MWKDRHADYFEVWGVVELSSIPLLIINSSQCDDPIVYVLYFIITWRQNKALFDTSREHFTCDDAMDGVTKVAFSAKDISDFAEASAISFQSH